MTQATELTPEQKEAIARMADAHSQRLAEQRDARFPNPLAEPTPPPKRT